MVLGGFGWFWTVLDGFGWFWVVPCFSNYEFATSIAIFTLNFNSGVILNNIQISEPQSA